MRRLQGTPMTPEQLARFRKSGRGVTWGSHRDWPKAIIEGCTRQHGYRVIYLLACVHMK